MKLTYLTKTLLTFLIINIALILISLIGLAFGNYYITVSLVFGTVCAFINLFLLLKASEALKPNSDKKGVQTIFLLANAFRTLIALGAIALSALVIYLTVDPEVNKLIYLSILPCGLPFILIAIVTVLVKDSEEINEE